MMLLRYRCLFGIRTFLCKLEEMYFKGTRECDFDGDVTELIHQYYIHLNGDN